MHVDVIELLRCPRAHEESWLVAAFDRMAGRHVVEGRLGCPVCQASYPIERGVVRFDAAEGEPRPGRPAPDAGQGAAGAPDDDGAMRAAAYLNLAGAGGAVVLSGSWSVHAERMALFTEDIHLLLHDGHVVPEDEDTGPISAIASPGRLPVGAETLRGVALDDAAPGGTLLDDAVRALRPSGRLVAPASASLPAGVVELARDERLWVAERRTAPRLVTLGRGGGR